MKTNSHINENKLLYEYQFGFQKGKSTYLAIMMLVDKITEALDQGECVVGVFLDFSKAFDTVDHNILYIIYIIFCKHNHQCLWYQWLYHWVFHVWMPVWNHSLNIQ